MVGIKLDYVFASGAKATLVESAVPAPKGGQPLAVQARDPAAVEIRTISDASTVLYYTNRQHGQLASMYWVTKDGTGVFVFFVTPVKADEGLAIAASME